MARLMVCACCMAAFARHPPAWRGRRAVMRLAGGACSGECSDESFDQIQEGNHSPHAADSEPQDTNHSFTGEFEIPTVASESDEPSETVDTPDEQTYTSEGDESPEAVVAAESGATEICVPSPPLADKLFLLCSKQALFPLAVATMAMLANMRSGKVTSSVPIATATCQAASSPQVSFIREVSSLWPETLGGAVGLALGVAFGITRL